MNAGQLTSGGDVLAGWRAPAARADGTVGDDARHIDAEAGIVSADANRDDPYVTGHRVIEVTPVGEAA